MDACRHHYLWCNDYPYSFRAVFSSLPLGIANRIGGKCQVLTFICFNL